MPKHPRTVLLEGFKGLNNVLRPENTPPEYLKKADNVDIDKQGNILKRKGYTKVDSGNYTTLWSNESGTLCYAVKDNNLVKVNQDYSTTLLKANVDAEISFEEVGEVVYFVSKNYTGKIVNDSVHSFGINKCSSPSLNYNSGLLQGGTYQVSCTFVDSNGLESGASLPSVITIPDNSSITFIAPSSSNPDVTSVRVYVSSPDGQILYYYSTVTPAQNVVVNGSTSKSNPLKLFNLYPAVKGDIIKYYRGRLYIVQDNIIWYSEPYQLEHYKLDSNYIEFNESIIELMPVENGIWVCTTKGIYYLSGNTPESFTSTLKENAIAVKGTSQKFSGSYIQLDNTPVGYKWLITTNLGIFVAFNQGVIFNLTSTNLNLDSANKGTSVFLKEQGLNQYLTILNKNDNENNSVMGDTVTTSIIRNGINIG